MKFKFRLASILKLREAQRTEKQSELAEALHADQILVQQITSIGQRMEETTELIRQEQVTSLDLDYLLRLKRQQAQFRGQLVELFNQRQMLEQEIARRQMVLAEANKELKTIESLEEKAKEEHRQKLAKREQEVLDEFRLPASGEQTI